MNNINAIKLVLTDNSGVTAIEYGLIASLIFLVIIAGVSSLGGNLGILYDDIATKVVAAL